MKKEIFKVQTLFLLMFFTSALSRGQEQGPGYICSVLTIDGVFEAPLFESTNTYDQHNPFMYMKGLFFDALSYHGSPTRVFCWYGIPESLEPGEKAPAVVLVHGGGGTVFPKWVKKWNDHGYIAISVALEGQVPGPRTDESPLEVGHPDHEFSGPFRRGFFLDLMDEKLQDQWFYHAVADVILAHSLVRSFPEVDTTRIGITGISWGGILTNVITGIDHRFDFSVPVYGCGYLHEAPLYIRQLERHTEASRQYYLQNWEPSLYVPLNTTPTLLLNGTNDKHFPMNSFTKTYDAANCEKYLHVEHEMPHGHQAGWDPEIIYRFADYICKGAEAPLQMKVDQKKQSVKIMAGKVHKATAYYTADPGDWTFDKYEWTALPARISGSGKNISADFPAGAGYYFYNCEMENGSMYSTPMKQR